MSLNSSMAVLFHEFFRGYSLLNSTISQNSHRHKDGFQRWVNVREKVACELQPQLHVLTSWEYFTFLALLQADGTLRWKMSKFLIGRWQISLYTDHIWKRL